MSKYEIIDHFFNIGKCFVLKSDWSHEFASIIEKENISVLRLCDSRGWLEKNLDFLDEIRNIKGIEIEELFTTGLNDMTPLYKLMNLSYMSLGVDFGLPFDLSKFPHLVILQIQWNSKVHGISGCKNLEYLNIDRYPFETLAELSELTKLQTLKLFSKKLCTTRGISKLRELLNLEISSCPKLECLSEINSLSNLTKLDISNCKRINNYDLLGELNMIDHIALRDCGSIDSINWVRNCRSLRRFFVVGDVSIRDGDLSPILDLPKLKDVGLASHRHYKPSRQEIYDIIAARKT